MTFVNDDKKTKLRGVVGYSNISNPSCYRSKSMTDEEYEKKKNHNISIMLSEKDGGDFIEAVKDFCRSSKIKYRDIDAKNLPYKVMNLDEEDFDDAEGQEYFKKYNGRVVVKAVTTQKQADKLLLIKPTSAGNKRLDIWEADDFFESGMTVQIIGELLAMIDDNITIRYTLLGVKAVKKVNEDLIWARGGGASADESDFDNTDDDEFEDDDDATSSDDFEDF